MAVCLRLAAGGSVAGVGESALRALSKLDQVMPARLRSQVSAVHDATVTLTVELLGLTRRTRRADDAGSGLPRPRTRRRRLHRPRRQRHRTPAGALSARDDGPALVSAGLRPGSPGLAQPATGPDGRRPRARQHLHPAGGARCGRLRPPFDQLLALPLRGARTVLRARTRCRAALLADIGHHRARRPRRLHAHRGRRRPRADGVLSDAAADATSRCSNRPRWPRRSSPSPNGSAARRSGGDTQPVGEEQERRRELVVRGVRAHLSQSTCSRTARTAGSSAAKSQWCSLSERSFSLITASAAAPASGSPARRSPRRRIVVASTGMPLSRCSTSMTNLPRRTP